MIKYNKNLFTGLHILGEIKTKKNKRLYSYKPAKEYISKIIKKFGLRELGSCYHNFLEEGGFTGIVSLAESHISIHTWPEFNYLTLDVYICNYKRNNTERCKEIFQKISEYFKPYKIKKRLIER